MVPVGIKSHQKVKSEFSDINISLGKDLLQKILEANQKQRCSLEDAIEHPWLTSYLSNQERNELLENTLRFIFLHFI